MGSGHDDGERRFYQRIAPVSRREVVEMLARDDPRDLGSVAISVSMYEEDFDWAQEICVRLARHPDPIVRGNAVLSFGHLARRFRKLDLATVQPIYRDAMADEDEHVGSQAESMVDDIRFFLQLDAHWPDNEIDAS